MTVVDGQIVHRAHAGLCLQRIAHGVQVDARRHASFTKDFAPLAGRNFRISARASF